MTGSTAGIPTLHGDRGPRPGHGGSRTALCCFVRTQGAQTWTVSLLCPPAPLQAADGKPVREVDPQTPLPVLHCVLHCLESSSRPKALNSLSGGGSGFSKAPDASRVITPSTSSDRARGLPSEDAGPFPQAWLEHVTPTAITVPHTCALVGGAWGAREQGHWRGRAQGRQSRGSAPPPPPARLPAPRKPQGSVSVTFLGEALGRIKGRQSRTDSSARDLKERKRGDRRRMFSAETSVVPTMLLGMRSTYRGPFPARAWKPQMPALPARAKSPALRLHQCQQQRRRAQSKVKNHHQGLWPWARLQDHGLPAPHPAVSISKRPLADRERDSSTMPTLSPQCPPHSGHTVSCPSQDSL